MTVITALLSALLGGVLVMAGDYVRRRVERRQDAVNNLVEASAHLSSVYNRLCGELIDAAERAVPAGDVPAMDPVRYEASTRFFMTPGSEEIGAEAARLIRAYERMRSTYGRSGSWEAAREDHYSSVRAFEGAVRRVRRRGHI
ncbi:hypothetical protein ACN6LC_006217 [Streptomyces violaceoruber]|uniref:hypothetical protein n=2 Tax=Streptomyces TaxID=1883 RepID=UPI0029B8BA81|nr:MULTISPECIES: hypothetical protein [unclassified Streptomyces]MDX3404606.1 hypothetical protein [Streptomyces sp. ME01-18h]MDX3412400.1 hypothetical protein [Streptomyces sp. ME02-6977A]